jgi:hypothetical protein
MSFDLELECCLLFGVSEDIASLQEWRIHRARAIPITGVVNMAIRNSWTFGGESGVGQS